MPFIILTAFSVLATWLTIKDARRRDMNATGWGILVLATAGIGASVYLMMRKPIAA